MIDKKLIKEVIDGWDPIGLFPDCPSDEYSMEIDEIFSVANQKSETAEELGEIVYKVLKKYFDGSFTKTKTECIRIAEKIASEKDG